MIHKSKSNVGANIATEDISRLSRFRYLYRNDVYLYRREGLQGFAYETVRLFGHAMRVLFKAPNYKNKDLQLL
uniref:CAZy families GT2 protein n=1 Tax=uncultured Lactobacillus sp. TaxID=153152 RepID=A0A060CCI8_9LACO|nr:CAZy families GT2 protein [uncultured Lactobacillus sp.]